VSGDSLAPLQRRILEALAVVEPPFRLTGGGALAGFHAGRRATRDLDLFWRGRERLDELPRAVAGLLEDAGLDVAVVQQTPTFHRFVVRGGAESSVLDPVAEPAPSLEPAVAARVGSRTIAVDSAHEILVSKLCALLSRAELRDLVDIRVLLAAGGDLARAVAEAPRKDAGFSPPTVAWLLAEIDPAAMGRAVGLPEAEVAELAAFHRQLTEQMAALGAPE
jgi:hypothetical protein